MRQWLGGVLYRLGLRLVAGGKPRRFVSVRRADWSAEDNIRWLARVLSNERDPDSFDYVVPTDLEKLLCDEYVRLEADRTAEYMPRIGENIMATIEG
jgi:hypothetical protein